MFKKDNSIEHKLKAKLRSYFPQMKGISISYGNRSESKLLITPSATKDLMVYFGWGETSAKNCFELLAGLAGFVRDYIIVVEHIIPVNLNNRDEKTAEFSYNNYLELKREIEI